MTKQPAFQDMTEKKLSEQELYKGRILRLHLDRVLLPDGREAYREVADHPGGVAVLAIDDKNRAAVVRQYRYAFSRMFTEIPAGKREPGEPPLETAKRELREEIGATAAEWTDYGRVVPSPGCYGETLYLFKATGLSFGEMHLDEDEFLSNAFVPVEELTEMCLDGRISDAKTVIALLKYRLSGK